MLKRTPPKVEITVKAPKAINRAQIRSKPLKQLEQVLEVDTGSDLGVLSAKYESNGDPGAISNTPGDPGGKSYGAYQLASNEDSVNSFLKWLKVNNSEYYQKLITAKQDDGDTFGTSFDKAWQQIAEADQSVFLNLQHSYIKYAYYDPLAKKLKDEYGFDINTKSKALQNVFWSTAVQHGYYAIEIFVAAGLSGNDEQIINGVYDERKLYLNGCSEQVKRSVISRYESERKDALNMLKG